MIDFGREISGELAAAERREWLVTNGIGGFAMGTVAGLLTRRYHGLLVAALNPPLGRTLILTKFDETTTYDGQDFPLFTNRWADGTLEPMGFHYLERFRLEGTTPVWTFALGDALLEKRVWMQQGANTTYVSYFLRRATAPLAISIKILANYRDYHGTTESGNWSMRIGALENGLRLQAFEGATPLFVLSEAAGFEPKHCWYNGYHLSLEAYRGQNYLDANLHAGNCHVTLRPGDQVALVASTVETPELNGSAAYAHRQEYERRLLSTAKADGFLPDDDSVSQLILAADQFIVRRSAPGQQDGRTIIAGYPWFGDWGRDTMISLPGLTLATGRPDTAAQILRTYAHFVDRGMLPNRFPDTGQQPEYNTTDATLWYFEAVRATYGATQDAALLVDLFPVLRQIVDWHVRGTRYNIHLDPKDGLLYAGENGVQLTWMDAKVGDRVVTPRIGKPVEISALWYNALRSMAEFARLLKSRGEEAYRLTKDVLNDRYYDKLAEQTRRGFARFWNDSVGYCYDVLDGPDGHEDSMRPNQLFAVSLDHSPLTISQQKQVVDVCARHLLTSHGFRSLAQNHPDYIGSYGGNQRQRDAAYHQGTVWSWLIGPFVAAHLRVYGDPASAQELLRPLLHHLADHGLGSISEIFDGDPPFVPRGCPAQAWSVAELLRAQQLTSSGES